MTQRLRNITIAQYRKFLTNAGCKHTRTSGGHEHWTRSDLMRPITFQTHIEPVPEFIVKQAMRTLGIDREEFSKMLD